MYRQNGLDILEFECEILSSQIKKDTARSSMSIHDLKNKFDHYSSHLRRLSAEHDPYASCASDDALELLYEDFLKRNIDSILQRIERYYENEIRNLLDTETVHFTFFAKKIAYHNLYHHGVSQIVSDRFRIAATNEIRSIPHEKLIPKALPLIERKYAYFSDRIICCLEIGNKLRALK